MNFKYIATFIGGGIVGAAVTWYITKNKYEQFSENDKKEIDELRKMYRSKMSELASKNMTKPEPTEIYTPNEDTTSQESTRDPELIKYDKILAETKYKYRDKYDRQEEGGEESMPSENITIIDSGEYMSYNGYEKRNLVLYRDEILADEVTDDISLIEDSIGQEAVNILKNERPEAIYVRNEEAQTEYEVTWDNRTYGEVTGIYIKDDD